jgi:CheY-like chemotaxis protein
MDRDEEYPSGERGSNLNNKENQEQSDFNKFKEKVEAELKKDPTADAKLPEVTPSGDKVFKPKKKTFFNKLGDKISETTKWGVMLNSLFGIGASGCVWLTGLGFAKSIDFVQYIIAASFILLGFGGWLLVRRSERKEREQLIGIASKQQDMKQDQENHEQEIEFKKIVFDNDQEIKNKRAQYQLEIDHNQNIEIWNHFAEISKDRPEKGDDREVYLKELELYSTQSQLAEKVLETFVIDRSLKYGKYEEYATNNLLKIVRKVSDDLNILVKHINEKTSPLNNISREYYQDEIMDKLSNIERMEIQAKSNALKADYLLHEDVGIVEVDEDLITHVNDYQAMYSGAGIYDWIGKSLIDFIEQEYPTDQRNILLTKIIEVRKGNYMILALKNMITAAGQKIDVNLSVFPKFNKDLLVIGFTIITTEYNEKEATETITFPEEECLDCSQVLILIANPTASTIKQQERMLKHLKYTTYSAKTITEAKRVLSEQEIDIVITDIYFDDGNALDFCIEAKKTYPFLKIIIFASIENKTLKKQLSNLTNVFAYHELNGRIIDFMTSIQKATISVLEERTQVEREKGKILNGELNKLAPSTDSVLETVKEKESKSGGVDLTPPR